MICLGIALGVNLAFGQKTVAADSLKYYKGEIVKVCEKVSTTFVTLGQEKTTILNFGPEFPHQYFTVIIFQEDLPNFSYDPATHLKDKYVCVIGDVRLFSSGPEIIVEREDQIRLSQ
jgi:hypothetical protein